MPFQRSHIGPRSRRATARAAAAILASALLNLGALALLERAGAFRIPGAPEQVRVGLAPLSDARWRANRAVASGAERTPAPPERRDARQPDDAMPSRPVVAVAPSPDSRRPERARFLADRDNTVPREVQLGARAPPRPGTILARPSAGAPGEQGVPVPGQEGEAERSAPGREGEPDAAARDRIARARIALAPAGASAGPASPADGEGGARRAGRFDPRLLPAGARYDAPAGGGPMDETLPDVPTGDETMLDTWGFRYADFFRRVHDAIKGQWDPNRAWDARDPHDRILGRGTRRVLLDIVLEPTGRLKDVQVVRGSGLDFFDRECVRAIEAAAPFPNPPRALVNGDGVVVLRRYGLTFTWPAGDALRGVGRALGGG